MECKYEIIASFTGSEAGINRNIVECKLEAMYPREYRSVLELIETLWNVNEEIEGLRKGRLEELIETLWNVNNKKAKEISDRLQELIETLWNVNRIILSVFVYFSLELIETLWNVNSYFFLLL